MSTYGEEPEGILTVDVASEQDVFALRRYGRAAARSAGLENLDQVRLATALSELGRDLLRTTPLAVDFSVVGVTVPILRVRLAWSDGRVPTPEALSAASRLLPRVDHRAGLSEGEGRVVIEHVLPRDAARAVHTTTSGNLAGELSEQIRLALTAVAEVGREEELRAQTRDLIAALEDSKARSEELERLNLELAETNTGVVALYNELSRELEETNRGVVALYAELEEKSRLLREASEAKTRLWSNVSHELRTPLNSVVGLSRLLMDAESEPLTATQLRQVSLVASAGSTLLALVDELLDVAKAEAGRVQPHFAPVDLSAVFAHLHDILAATAPGDGVALRIPDHGGLPGLVTDEVMLIRILRNLLSNSLKFTRQGEVGLNVSRDPDGRLVFEVADTGVGVPLDQQAAVFEEFYQVPGPHQRGHTGTGLGLPYARRLAELLGGTLTLESTPGSGTRVTLRIPAAPTLQSAHRRLGALVTVDDDPGFHDLCRQELAVLADRVIEVCDGRLAVETVARERPDAVLVDLHMPEMDGYAVLAALHGDPALRAVPVVVVTSADPSLVDADRLLHATAVVSKSRLTARTLAAALFPEEADVPTGGRP